MIALGKSILSTVEGLKILKLETMVNQMVNVNYFPFTFAYQWHLNHTETSSALIEETEIIMTTPNVMCMCDLHCISLRVVT